jgi:hypothetical protein
MQRFKTLSSRNLMTTSTVRLALVLIVLTGYGCSESSDPGTPRTVESDTIVADHTFVTDFDLLTQPVADSIRQNYSFYYGHTSHGSQIITGLQMLASEAARWALPEFHEVRADLGHHGNVTWAGMTRSYLDDHPGQIDVVMWSWCSGVSDNTVEGIDIYLQAMSDLERDYPDVIFIYMTGHLDGSGEDGNLRARNNQIREYCRTNQKVLFDFADIESYDPDGNFYPDETDACNWCIDWCAEHDCPECSSCAHSHCFNCYRKGQAFWCMMAEVLAKR